jgi:hypothetical protein
MKWEPIENAPTEQPVLVTDGLHVLCGAFTSYHQYQDAWWAVEFTSGTGRWRIAGTLLRGLTHFMLFPEPPQI